MGPALDAAQYRLLRERAAAALAQGAMTLRPTELLHEAWLRMADLRPGEGREEGIGLWVRALRFAMVDLWRERQSEKRGGKVERVSIDELATGELPLVDDAGTWLDLDRALTRMESEQPELAALVELRCFGGMSVEQAAEAAGMSVATAVRRWRFAKAWLLDALGMVETSR